MVYLSEHEQETFFMMDSCFISLNHYLRLREYFTTRDWNEHSRGIIAQCASQPLEK